MSLNHLLNAFLSVSVSQCCGFSSALFICCVRQNIFIFLCMHTDKTARTYIHTHIHFTLQKYTTWFYFFSLKINKSYCKSGSLPFQLRSCFKRLICTSKFPLFIPTLCVICCFWWCVICCVDFEINPWIQQH